MINHNTGVSLNKVFRIFLLFALLSIIIMGVASVIIMCSSDKTVICIDAGHGGNDFGAISGDRKEKDDNLNLALEVRSVLVDRGYTVVMTRDDDTFVTLDNRCKFANRKQADLFVALHRNSVEGVANGVEIWVKNDKPEKDNILAQNILDCLVKTGVSENRGVKSGIEGNSDGNYYVNKYTDMPSCLVELGFITSETDNKMYDEKLNLYAIAIADGIEITLKNSLLNNTKM